MIAAASGGHTELPAIRTWAVFVNDLRTILVFPVFFDTFAPFAALVVLW